VVYAETAQWCTVRCCDLNFAPLSGYAAEVSVFLWTFNTTGIYRADLSLLNFESGARDQKELLVEGLLRCCGFERFWEADSEFHAFISSRVNSSVCKVGAARVAIFGGHYCISSALVNAKDVLIFDEVLPSKYYVKRCTGPNNVVPRTFHSTCSTNSETLWVMGGNQGIEPSFLVFKLSLETGVWTEYRCQGQAPTPRGSHACACTEDGRFIVVFGGVDMRSIHLNDLYVLDTASLIGKWVRVNQQGLCPPPRGGHTLTLAGDCMYLFGGNIKERYLNDLWCLNLDSWTWKRVSNLGSVPTPRRGHVSFMLNKRLWVWGGIGYEGVCADLASFSLCK